MTDEEKKAIERIDYIQDFIIENGQYNADVNDMEYFSKVLNLIEKQSKEIEELKEKNENLLDALNNSIDIKKYWVNKDKIKAKIEEYEKELNKLLQKEEWLEPHDTIKRNKYMHYIEFGQSLLEKE